MAIIKWPFGDASVVALSAIGAQAITIDNDMTIVDGVTIPATGSRTINLVVSESVKPGARIFLKLKTTGTETTVFGTGMSGETITGVGGVTKKVECVYDGTNFIVVENPVVSEISVTTWPFGDATIVELTATGTQAVTIDNDMTIVNGVTVPATGNRTINLTIGESVKIGARIFLKLKTTSTETTVFGTGMSGVTITGVGGKTICVEFVYDGTSFIEAGTPIQID